MHEHGLREDDEEVVEVVEPCKASDPEARATVFILWLMASTSTRRGDKALQPDGCVAMSLRKLTEPDFTVVEES